MLLELHLLQNFAPSNLNRDDTGSPKDCDFGGFRRARISSQCQKRAIREFFQKEQLFDPLTLGERTKRLRDAIGEELIAAGIGNDEADQIAVYAVRTLGLNFEKKNPRLTEYLVFIGRQDIEKLVDLCLTHQAELLAAEPIEDDQDDPEEGAATRRRKKGSGSSKNPQSDLKREFQSIWKSRSAVDIALFGRMLANLPDDNIRAACQVAHAISTNAVSLEFDFFTAVDDLNPKEETGAGMLGTVEFNSSCYYRYANIDLRQLQANLGGDTELARATVRAFLQAAIRAVPSGKQNSFAAQNPPSLVMGVVREDGAWSLANAFVKPVRPRQDEDLIEESVKRLAAYWGNLVTMYGDERITAQSVAVDAAYADHVNTLPKARVTNAPALIDLLASAAYPAQG